MLEALDVGVLLREQLFHRGGLGPQRADGRGRLILGIAGGRGQVGLIGGDGLVAREGRGRVGFVSRSGGGRLGGRYRCGALGRGGLGDSLGGYLCRGGLGGLLGDDLGRGGLGDGLGGFLGCHSLRGDRAGGGLRIGGGGHLGGGDGGGLVGDGDGRDGVLGGRFLGGGGRLRIRHGPALLLVGQVVQSPSMDLPQESRTASSLARAVWETMVVVRGGIGTAVRSFANRA